MIKKEATVIKLCIETAVFLLEEERELIMGIIDVKIASYGLVNSEVAREGDRLETEWRFTAFLDDGIGTQGARERKKEGSRSARSRLGALEALEDRLLSHLSSFTDDREAKRNIAQVQKLDFCFIELFCMRNSRWIQGFTTQYPFSFWLVIF